MLSGATSRLACGVLIPCARRRCASLQRCRLPFTPSSCTPFRSKPIPSRQVSTDCLHTHPSKQDTSKHVIFVPVSGSNPVQTACALVTLQRKCVPFQALYNLGIGPLTATFAVIALYRCFNVVFMGFEACDCR